MRDLVVDDRAVDYIMEYIKEEGTTDLRLFISGGGCCPRIEITSVDGPLSGDATYNRGDLTFHVDRPLVEGTSVIEINYDEHRGLLIDLLE